MDAQKKVDEYNSTHNIALEEIPPLKFHLDEFCNAKNSQLFVSSLPRAFLTAQTLFGDKYKIEKDDKFVEFDLNIVPIPLLHLTFRTWVVISRILWFMGALNTKRSFSFERARAKNAAEFLYEKSKSSEVALVAHDLLNLFIERHLKSKGYRRISKVKNGFFSITKLVKLPHHDSGRIS
jgi:broad specificity phosphatase PhoE